MTTVIKRDAANNLEVKVVVAETTLACLPSRKTMTSRRANAVTQTVGFHLSLFPKRILDSRLSDFIFLFLQQHYLLIILTCLAFLKDFFSDCQPFNTNRHSAISGHLYDDFRHLCLGGPRANGCYDVTLELISAVQDA